MIEVASWRWTCDVEDKDVSSVLLSVPLDTEDDFGPSIQIDCGSESMTLYYEEAMGLLGLLSTWTQEVRDKE